MDSPTSVELAQTCDLSFKEKGFGPLKKNTPAGQRKKKGGLVGWKEHSVQSAIGADWRRRHRKKKAVQTQKSGPRQTLVVFHWEQRKYRHKVQLLDRMK